MAPHARADSGVILTPDQRVRVFVSSTMEELAPERAAVRSAIEHLRLAPVLFELGARAHPPRSLYLSYLDQSHIFLGIYWQRYGWIAPDMEVSGLEDEYLQSGAKPKLIYVKRPAPDREPGLTALLDQIRSSDDVAYKPFSTPEELERLVTDDIALLLSENFLVPVHVDQDRPPVQALPNEVTAFVGRTGEVAQLRTLLEQSDVRMVTLTGPGGIGKTRLALRVAAELSSSFEEGAAFVGLAAVRDPELVPAAIAAAVGVREAPGQSLREALRTDLAARSLLLVLDNAEHVLEAASVLSEILDATTRVKLLVTSRAALRTRAEHEFPVDPLAPSDSVQLFAERASAARFGFVLDAGNAATIAAVCARVEHVPLAIELAAARTRLLPPEALLERLGRRLDFLVGGARDLPERQRALRNTMQWSYDLLDEAERGLFATMGAFVGGCSLSAVEAVHPASSDGASDVLELVASLVDKSLVRAETAAGEPRFRMLEMIREFARERLDESGTSDAVQERHAAYYRDLSVAVGQGVRGADQIRWLEVLGRGGDAENVRAALAWYLRHARLEAYADMAWALWLPAWINGRLEEGRMVADAGLAAAGAATDPSRAQLLVVSGMFNMWKGEPIAAVRALSEGLTLARTLGDEELVAYATVTAGMAGGLGQGEARAAELLEEGVERCRQLGDRWAEGVALQALGWLYVGQDRFDGTASVFAATMTAAAAVGDEQSLATAEINLAEQKLHDGALDDAARLLATSAARHRTLRSVPSITYLLDAAARLAWRQGAPEQAARLLGAADHLRAVGGVGLWGSHLDRRTDLVNQVRVALGTADFDAASQAGAHLGYAGALDEVEREG